MYYGHYDSRGSQGNLLMIMYEFIPKRPIIMLKGVPAISTTSL